MKYLEPKKVRVNSMTVVSTQTVEGGPVQVVGEDPPKEVRERRVFLGYFDESINSIDIEKVLTEKKLWTKVLSLDALYGDGFKTVSVIPRLITEGIVFENTDEFVQYLKSGLLYDDILEGYTMAKATGEIGV